MISNVYCNVIRSKRTIVLYRSNPQILCNAATLVSYSKKSVQLKFGQISLEQSLEVLNEDLVSDL